jgi:hypothetical protein
MPEVRIRKLETNYRLPRSARAERRRLDDLRTAVLDQAFTLAIEKAGLSDDAELCIRDLLTTVSLRLQGTDRALISHWSAVMAEEILDAIRNGSTSRAVVYQSRRQAVADLAISTARGDFRRAWAWRQLGLWQSRTAVSESQRVSEFVRALCSERGVIVPTLRVLAEAGWLLRMAERLTDRHWETLASTVLSEAGANNLLSQLAPRSPERALREARRVINRSSFMRALAASHLLSDASVLVRRSISALAIVEIEPALLRTETAAAVIEIISEACTEAPESLLTTANSDDTSNDITTSAARKETTSSFTAEPKGETTADDADAFYHQKSFDPADLSADASADHPRENATLSNRFAEADEKSQPIDLRERAFTRWGGLLFLLAVFEDLNLLEVILEHPVLRERPFTWVLHQLAMTIAPVSPDDPAALAFAGLSPDIRFKPQIFANELGSDQRSAAEICGLCELAESMIEHLSSFLVFEDEPPASLVEFVCRRRAEIVADPGWIEARFSLDEVSTEIRRAGLDLDPGYMSWLGIVMRFVYE